MWDAEDIAVEVVEAAAEATGEFDVLGLVFADRDE
jgi:hypothetical protein